MKMSVREIKILDIELVVDYFVNADADFLKGMGADKDKLPSKTDWVEKLKLELEKPVQEKEYYYLIWLINNQPIGHSNINNINYGKFANMHLHMWNSHIRRKGLGLRFVELSIPYYFKKFKLEKLICEPYAENIGPNKLLKKAGFKFIRKYDTVPGIINLYQSVNRFEMKRRS
jgi:RimJ/RimL family protein N-acetyltransferase